MTSASAQTAPLLRVQDLVTGFTGEAGMLRAVDHVSFEANPGRSLGIVGESGCGKSVTALSIMRLLPKPAGRILKGRIFLQDLNLLAVSPDAMHAIRGKKMAMIFQEPMTSLNPVHKIGHQIREIFELHFPRMSAPDIREASIEVLRRVGIPAPQRRIREYPHQISGGMRQRVMIAMALACRPQLLIADEPTTALDVTIQAQILDLIKSLQAETGMAVIFITHDLGVIAEVCDQVVVMYAGQVVESAAMRTLFTSPGHPYTRGLLASIPRLAHPRKTRLPIIQGMVPMLSELPPGCRFQNRCPMAQPVCIEPPPIKHISAGHFARCHFA